MQEDGASSYHRYLQGDPHALEELVRTYSDGLTRYAFLYVRDAFLAEDIMEDSFATLLIKRKQLADVLHFKAYLYKIARNKCMDYLRSKRRTELSLTGLEEVLAADDAEERAFRRERDKRVFECLERLPDAYREVLYFAYFEGYSPAEIGKMTGQGRKRVYNLLARGKTALKKILEKEGIGYEDI